jgi:hypothetical protein
VTASRVRLVLGGREGKRASLGGWWVDRDSNPSDSNMLRPLAENAQSSDPTSSDDAEANHANPGASNQEPKPEPKPEPAAGSDLDRAVAEAAKAGRWDVVVLLGRELEARRLSGANVVALDAHRRGATR